MDEKTITNPLNQGQENSNDPIKITVLGCGNVGVAIAADLSIGGHDVSLIKTSHSKESVFYKIRLSHQLNYVQLNARAHGRGQGCALDVSTL